MKLSGSEAQVVAVAGRCGEFISLKEGLSLLSAPQRMGEVACQRSWHSSHLSPQFPHHHLHPSLNQFVLLDNLSTRHCAKNLSMHQLIASSQQLYKIGTISNPILQVDKLRLKKSNNLLT